MNNKTENENIFIYIGNDEGLVNKNTNDKIKEFHQDIQNDTSSGLLEVYDGLCSNSEQIISLISNLGIALNTKSLFSSSKTVVVKNINFLGHSNFAKTTTAKNQADNFHQLLQNVSKDNIVIINTYEIDKRSKFFKFLKQKTNLFEFNKIDESKPDWQWQVASIVKEKSDQLNLVFDNTPTEENNNPLMLFVNLVGTDTNIINKELEKIQCYLGDTNTITAEVVKKLVFKSHTAIIFEVGEAIAKNQLQIALNLTEELIDKGKTIMEILHIAIIPKIRNLLYAKILSEEFSISKGYNYQSFSKNLENIPPEKISFLPKNKKNNTLNAYPIFLAMPYIKNFSLPKLKESINLCLKTNVEAISSSISDKLILNRLIFQILS